ncbi:MAG: GFA family protein [Pseudomonadota bacterium]
MADKHSGGCLCGAVTFEVAGPLRPILFCHCNQCRKQSGHFYAATSAPVSAILISGENRITWYESSTRAKRGFCSICGSALFWKMNDESEMSILAGSFDEPTELVADKHIFCESKGDYYEIGDGLPQIPRY